LSNFLVQLGREIKVTADGVEVLLNSETEAAELVSALVQHGVPITGVAPVTGALETAYLAMTAERR
jgi:ABC-2 type transport system ATP-binding protein